jgi:hypothetical protein
VSPLPEQPIVIGPRRFGGRRDVTVAVVFALAFVGALVAAFTIGTPGVIGTCYVIGAFAVWVQDFRRSWRVSADRIEERRWFRWRAVPGVDVVRVVSDRDDMGPRAVVVSGASGTLEISLDDCRSEPELARAVARFVSACERNGADVDPGVHRLVG